MRRSRSYPRVGSSSSNIYTGPFGQHTYIRATDSNANPRPADCYTYTSCANTDARAKHTYWNHSWRIDQCSFRRATIWLP